MGGWGGVAAVEGVSNDGSTTVIVLTCDDLKIKFLSSLQTFRLYVQNVFTVCIHGILLLYSGHKVALSGSIQDFHTNPLQSVTQNGAQGTSYSFTKTQIPSEQRTYFGLCTWGTRPRDATEEWPVSWCHTVKRRGSVCVPAVTRILVGYYGTS